MKFSERITDLTKQIAKHIKELRTKQGNLDNLKTTNKTNLVDAINENKDYLKNFDNYGEQLGINKDIANTFGISLKMTDLLENLLKTSLIQEVTKEPEEVSYFNPLLSSRKLNVNRIKEFNLKDNYDNVLNDISEINKKYFLYVIQNNKEYPIKKTETVDDVNNNNKKDCFVYIPDEIDTNNEYVIKKYNIKKELVNTINIKDFYAQDNINSILNKNKVYNTTQNVSYIDEQSIDEFYKNNKQYFIMITPTLIINTDVTKYYNTNTRQWIPFTQEQQEIMNNNINEWVKSMATMENPISLSNNELKNRILLLTNKNNYNYYDNIIYKMSKNIFEEIKKSANSKKTSQIFITSDMTEIINPFSLKWMPLSEENKKILLDANIKAVFNSIKEKINNGISLVSNDIKDSYDYINNLKSYIIHLIPDNEAIDNLDTTKYNISNHAYGYFYLTEDFSKVYDSINKEWVTLTHEQIQELVTLLSSEKQKLEAEKQKLEAEKQKLATIVEVLSDPTITAVNMTKYPSEMTDQDWQDLNNQLAGGNKILNFVNKNEANTESENLLQEKYISKLSNINNVVGYGFGGTVTAQEAKKHLDLLPNLKIVSEADYGNIFNDEETKKLFDEKNIFVGDRRNFYTIILSGKTIKNKIQQTLNKINPAIGVAAASML